MVTVMTTKIISLASATILLVFVLSGCTFWRDRSSRLTVLATIARTSTELGALRMLRDDANARPALALAEQTLSRLIADGSYDAVAFAEALRGLNTHLFNGPDGALVIGALVSVFEAATATQYELSSTSAVAVIMRAVRDGLNAALRSELKRALGERIHQAPAPKRIMRL